MRNLLKKWGASEELIDSLLALYKGKNASATDLPVYISQDRLNEVVGERDTARTNLATLTTEVEGLRPLKTEKDTWITTETTYKAQVDKLTKETAAIEKVLLAGGLDYKSISIHIDATKPIDDEVARVKKDKPFLFGEALPDGTGKKGNKGDSEADKKKAEDKAMRRAVGLPDIEE